MTFQKFDVGMPFDKLTSTFKTDSIDQNRWNKMVDSGSVSSALNNPVPGYQIEHDSFFGLCKPDLRFGDNLSDTQKHVAGMFSRAMQVDQFSKLRQKTVNNAPMSAIAANGFIDGVLYGLSDETKKDMEKQANKQAKAEQDLAKAVEMSQMAKSFSDAGEQDMAEEWQQEADKLQASGERAQRSADNFQESITEQIEESGVDLDYAIAEAAKAAQKKIDQADTVFKGFSEATDTDPRDFSAEVIEGLMKIIREHPNLDYFVKCLGWAQRKVGEIERQIAEGRVDIYDIESGELDIETMTPVELMTMAGAMPKAMTDDFWARVADDQVEQFVYVGTSPLGHGPLILVTDQSGSMEWNDNHTMVVALKWAIFGLCGRQNRRCVDIAFSGLGRYWEYDISQKDANAYMLHLNRFDAGGTEPYKPLTRAMELARDLTKKDKSSGADVCFFSDDDFGPVPTDFQAELARTKNETDDNFKLVSIILGQFGTGHKAEQFSDKVVFLADLMAEENREQLAQIMSEVA